VVDELVEELSEVEELEEELSVEVLSVVELSVGVVGVVVVVVVVVVAKVVVVIVVALPVVVSVVSVVLVSILIVVVVGIVVVVIVVALPVVVSALLLLVVVVSLPTANIASNMDINAGPPGNGLLSNGGTQSITTAAKGDVSPAEAVAPKPMVWKPPPAPKPAAVTAPVAEGNDTTTTNNGTKDETSSFVENDANINDEGIAALNASIPSHEIPMSTQTPSSTTETIELTAAEIDAELTNEAPPPPVAGNYDYGTNQASNLQTDWDNLDF
jgi:hypothetical protein